MAPPVPPRFQTFWPRFWAGAIDGVVLTGFGRKAFVSGADVTMLATIRSAQQILALEDGRIVESGTHDELLANDGLYARLWRQRERAARWRIETSGVASGVPIA